MSKYSSSSDSSGSHRKKKSRYRSRSSSCSSSSSKYSSRKKSKKYKKQRRSRSKEKRLKCSRRLSRDRDRHSKRSSSPSSKFKSSKSRRSSSRNRSNTYNSYSKGRSPGRYRRSHSGDSHSSSRRSRSLSKNRTNYSESRSRSQSQKPKNPKSPESLRSQKDDDNLLEKLNKAAMKAMAENARSRELGAFNEPPPDRDAILKYINSNSFAPQGFSSNVQKQKEDLPTIYEKNDPVYKKEVVTTEEPGCLLNPNLLIDDYEEKLNRWVKKIYQIRQRSINGEPLNFSWKDMKNILYIVWIKCHYIFNLICIKCVLI